MTNVNSEVTVEGYLFPLSSAQKRLWTLAHLQPDDLSYNVPFALEIKGALDCGALESALLEVVQRHEILHTSFVQVDGEPMQVILADFQWAMRFDEGKRERDKVLEQIQLESAQPFDLTEAPLFRATLYTLDADQHILFLNFHHIVCDAWSFGVLLRELSALYPKYVSGRRIDDQVMPEIRSQYADYSEWHNQ